MAGLNGWIKRLDYGPGAEREVLFRTRAFDFWVAGIDF
jgi:hypothetical protein